MATTHHIKRRATSGEGTNVIVARLIYITFTIIVCIILARMVLLMMGVNQHQPVAQTIYDISLIFLSPFFILFGYTPTYGAPVFEIGSVVAVLVYILLGWGLAVMVTMGTWHSDEV